MPDSKSPFEYNYALEDFRKARSKAELQRLRALITGKTDKLLPYDEITQRLHATGFSSKGLKEIPVDAIVGSVNRYQDFNHNFLPLHDEDRQRWATVKAMMTTPGSMGLPPIRVYKLGDAYFVLDGNHRVSIAKEMGLEMVEAYVTEIKPKVPLSPDDTPEDIILKEEYADFLVETQMDRILSDANLQLTFPGLYETLLEHIRVHRYYMGIEQKREIPWDEAVRDWYDKVYLPVVRVIREQDIMQEFPDKTETDLYIWILDHQTYMQQEIGWPIRTEKAASDLIEVQGKKVGSLITDFFEKTRQTLTPRKYDQTMRLNPRDLWDNRGSSLFMDILVAISGQGKSWFALDQAIQLAKMEQADVRGLIVVPEDEIDSKYQEEVEQNFSECMQEAGLNGNLVHVEGPIAETIIQRSRVNDLVVIRLSHPPVAKIFPRLGSGIRKLVRKCPKPILMVRNQVTTFDKMLLAYDGSSKGKEALYITTYLAAKYGKCISVLVVNDDKDKGQALLKEAKDYIGEMCTHVTLRRNVGIVSETILKAAQDESADCIVMGGYGLSPLMEALFGSTVDGVLRKTTVPVLVCQ
ncbi:universal stress protein [Chloroflexota bacterium]|nr:universal stress protein [Chloroflexota bacterium]